MKNYKPKPKFKGSMKGRQGKKDSKSTRVNFDNERESKFEKDYSKVKSTSDNDISWYAHNPELLKSAGSIGFAATTGQPIPIKSTVMDTIPGIMALGWVPAIGSGNINAVKQAQESIYSFVVHANSRNQSYDPVDLMQMILGTANAFSWIAHAIRAYGVMRKYEGVNAYTPRAIIKAMGFNYDDLQKNLANMWFDINDLVAMSAQLWIPNDLSFVKRWFWLNTNLYYDAESPKGQIYMFVPRTPWVYNPVSTYKGGALESYMFKSITNNGVEGTNVIPDFYDVDSINALKGGMQWSNFMKMIRDVLYSYINVQDRGIMLGDVLKAYGADKIYALSEIPSNYQTPLVYNQEVLTQIENATMTGATQPRIAADEYGTLVSTVATGSNPDTDRWIPKHAMLNFHKSGQPTPEEVMIATRFTCAEYVTKEVDTGMYRTEPAVYGTELLSGAAVYAYYWGSGNTPTLQRFNVRYQYTSGNINPSLPSLVGLFAFDWAPHAYYTYLPTTDEMKQNTQGDPLYWFMDFCNSIPVTKDDLYKLHNTAVYSEFGVPKL